MGAKHGDEGIMSIPGASDGIDAATFEQILEMDEDEEEREFSKSIVYDFFTQAESTFGKMDSNLEQKNLRTLSELGHFLKEEGLAKLKTTIEQAKQEFYDVEK